MATTVTPLKLRIGALNPTFNDNPQAIADAIEANAEIITQEQLAFFVSGGTKPTSDSGPWLKDGQEWQVWDTTTGDYIPLVMDPLSLRYYIGSATPAHADYDVWFKTDVGGAPQGLFIYYNSAWTTVTAYDHYTKAQVDAFFEGEDGGKKQIERANVTGNGELFSVVGVGGSDLALTGDYANYTMSNLNTVLHDTKSGWSASTKTYTIQIGGYYSVYGQAQFELVTGVPTSTWYSVAGKFNGTNPCGSGVIGGVKIGGPVTVNFQYQLHCNPGDTIKLVAIAGSDPGTCTFKSAANENAVLTITQLL
jgi:hypothetical protein